MKNHHIILKRKVTMKTNINMYFYTLRTLMLYYTEIRYQLESKWNLSQDDPWISAELHLTSGKSNARTEVTSDVGELKSDYNLKRILNTPTAYNRIHTIGRLVMVAESMGLDSDSMMSFMDDDIVELFTEVDNSIDPYEWTQSNYSILESKGLIDLIDEDFLYSYISTPYMDEEIRDDLGMIQNTMRRLIIV